MDFRTIVRIPSVDFTIDYTTQLMLFGSCFSENIGNKLLENKFSVDVNPFGILYNPLSISIAIRRLLRSEQFVEEDIVFNQGVFQSFFHHGSFSHPNKQQCLAQISNRFNQAAESIRKIDLLLITFGTASVFRLKNSNAVVGNCHKFPADAFVRQRLSVNEICAEWTDLIDELLALNPKLKIVFTVSPIRHFKDGAHENQISKSTLHLAIAQLEASFPSTVFYFPAYEIVMDELRDYRYYASDMLHLSDVAVEYIWDRFVKTYFSKETCAIMDEWESINKALNHRSLYGMTDNFFAFLSLTKQKLLRFAQKYPFISCEKEINEVNSTLENH